MKISLSLKFKYSCILFLLLEGLFLICRREIAAIAVATASTSASDPSSARDDDEKANKELIKYLKLRGFYKTIDSCPKDINKSLKEGIKLFINRHIESSNLQKSIEIFNNVLKVDPQNGIALHMMATAHYWLGIYDSDTDKKLKAYQKIREYAEKLVELEPENEWGYFWLFANLGMIAKTKGLLQSIALLPSLKRAISKCIELNPNFSEGYSAQGMMFHELPVYLGGGYEKAVKSFKKCIDLDPDYTKAYLELARTYIKLKKFDEAKKCLNKLIRYKEPKYPADYFTYDLPEGKKLLESIK